MTSLTFLFTDMEGSTALLRRLGEDAYAQVLTDHHRIIRTVLSTHDGKEIATQGDGFFALFSSPRTCVAAVVEMQRAIEAQTWPIGEHVRVRMGVHFGEATESSTGLVGFDVHRAARIAAVAYGGQVLISETAAALVRDSLPAGVTLRDLGLHRLKDLGRPERIFQLDAEGLSGDFPPLRSLDNPALANNLPAQLSTFIGRARELDDVRTLVESSRLVTLTGAGGSGKTRLALQVAAEFLDGSGDGVWLVELASVTDEEGVPRAIADALGITGLSPSSSLDVLLEVLSVQRVLIVLDNCEHLIGMCALLADSVLRKCPEVRLVTTSREPLGIGGETIYRVPSLSLPASGDPASPGQSDAVALFVDRTRAQGVDLSLDENNTPLVVSICRRLDGMPLAIELAAARLRSLALADVSNRLDQRFRLLTRGSRSALPRQQTLRATVDWSYSLLDAPERSVLRRLSVFIDGFDLDAAEAICGFGDIEGFDVTDIVASLVDKSLVVAEQLGENARYRLLETIRQFASERLLEHDVDEAAAVGVLHCEYFVVLAETAAPHLTGRDQGRWLAQLIADQSNLQRALEHAAGDPNGTAAVLRYAAAFRDYRTGNRGQGLLKLLEPVLDRPEATLDPQRLVGALLTAATAASVNDLPSARRLAERAIEVARQLEDDRWLIRSLSVLCGAYNFAGDPETARACGEEAVARARVLGDDRLLSESLSRFLIGGKVLDPGQVEELYREAIACAERSGDGYMMVMLHNNAANQALQTGNIPDAHNHLDEATRLSHEIGVMISNVKITMGVVLREEGDFEAARETLSDGLRISRRNGDRFGLAYSTSGLACLASDLADWQRSAELHGVAQSYLDQIGHPWLPYGHRFREASLETVRARLGDEQFRALYTRGRQLTFDRAIESALKVGSG